MRSRASKFTHSAMTTGEAANRANQLSAKLPRREADGVGAPSAAQLDAAVQKQNRRTKPLLLHESDRNLNDR